jgi:predicted dehydrogenase
MKHTIGVIGSGTRGRRYIASISASPYFQVLGFNSSDWAESRALIKDFNHLPLLTIEELIHQSETLVFSKIYPGADKDISTCLKYGKNLILPNYQSFNLTQLQQFSRIATESDSIVICGSPVFFNPALQLAREYLNNPVFIDVARLQPFSSSGGNISILNDMLIQDIDWVLHSVESNVKRISVNPVSVMNRKDPDFINLKLEFDNGCIANLTASRISELSLKKSRIYYDKNVLYVDLLNQELKRSYQNGEVVSFEEVEIEKQDEVKMQINELHLAIKEKSKKHISITRAIAHFQILAQIEEKIKLKSTFLPV